jgi:putative endonuclease
MAFWAYKLHCRGGYFYVGHTDDLERRMAQHKSGAFPGFSRDHSPVELVGSEAFVSREEAKSAEKRIKVWTRAKKLALIRGDWDRVVTLAKSKSSPSTSSGHPDSPGHG